MFVALAAGRGSGSSINLNLGLKRRTSNGFCALCLSRSVTVSAAVLSPHGGHGWPSCELRGCCVLAPGPAGSTVVLGGTSQGTLISVVSALARRESQSTPFLLTYVYYLLYCTETTPPRSAERLLISHEVLGRVGAQLDLGLVEGVHRLCHDLVRVRSGLGQG